MANPPSAPVSRDQQDRYGANTLTELLQDQELAFVERAYRTLLKRAADRQGREYYLAKLLSGAPKIEILLEIAKSTEARRAAVKIPGLAAAIGRYRLARLPIIGPIARLFVSVERNSPTENRLRALEQQQFLNLRHFEERLRQIGLQLHNLQYGVPGSFDSGVLAGPLQSGTQAADSLEHEKLRPIEPVLRAVDARSVEIVSSNDPTISVIIPIHGKIDYTLRCLASIAANPPRAPFEVIVVDDCSPDQSAEVLSGIKGLRLIRSETNQGFSRSCNRGANAARGEYLHFLNNDTEVTSEWLDALLRVFETRPDAGLVGSKLIYPDGSLQEAGGIIWQNGSAWKYGRNDDAAKPAYNYLRETDYCSSASVMMRTALWNSLGGFDLRYGLAYCEDSDLAFRVREAGYAVYVQPKSVVVHHEGKSEPTDTGTQIEQSQSLNRQKLVERWGSVIANHRAQGVDVFRARERSLDKPVILFIDHYLPHFDQDAGSRTIWAFVKLFLSEGFSVKFLGDNFYPHQPYQTMMEEMGIEVLTGAWMSKHWEEWLRQNGDNLDYVMLSRAHTAQRYLEPLKASTNAKILFYGHDLISRTARNQYLFSKDPAKLEESQRFRQLEANTFAVADVVYYPSQSEIDELSMSYPDLNAQVLTPFVYEKPSYTPGRFRGQISVRRGLLFVGGFRHLPNVEAVLWFCTEVMPTLVEQLPGIHLTIAGSYPPPEIAELASPQVTVTGYVSDEALAKLYEESRVIVVPLLTGGGIKGKVTEALSHAVPIVTTPVGAEGVLEAATAVRIASPHDFAAQIVSVYDNPEVLEEMVMRGVEIVANHYSVAALKNTLAKEVRFKAPATVTGTTTAEFRRAAAAVAP
jgi:O-antigen biosynthesis protein